MRTRSLHLGPSEKVQYLNVGSFEKFLIAEHPKEDHNEQDFKCYIIGRILDLLKKSSKTREGSIKLSMTASILDLLKILSEVIVAFKCGPLVRIEKQAIS